jgi:hypothetical protein
MIKRFIYLIIAIWILKLIITKRITVASVKATMGLALFVIK